MLVELLINKTSSQDKNSRQIALHTGIIKIELKKNQFLLNGSPDPKLDFSAGLRSPLSFVFGDQSMFR